MQCQALLELHRGSVAPQDPVPTNPTAQEERRAPDSAGPLGDEKIGLGRKESHNNKANVTAKHIFPPGEAKLDGENTEPEVSKETEDARRNLRASHTRKEEQWFDPLTFR
jgi:hypothetical protein